VESASESIEPLLEPVNGGSSDGLASTLPALAPALRRVRPAWVSRLAGVWVRVRFAVLVYVGTRLILVAVAFANGAVTGHPINHELTNWDGAWYQFLTLHGYPDYAYHAQSTLGFFPLYSALVWVASRPVLLFSSSVYWSTAMAGAAISIAGGLVTTVLVQRLATGWWGREAGRRAVLLFCLFPGSVVFFMAYAEGIMLPLVAGCILALQRRRWVLAGILAGLATACEPEAVIIVLVCLVSALLHVRRQGWRQKSSWRSMAAPLLSLTGIGAFAIFLWAWTGTPFAAMIAQHYGWGEKTDPIAVINLFSWLFGQIHFSHFNSHPTIDLNLVVGAAGVMLLIPTLYWLFKSRRRVGVAAIVWTLGIVFLAVTSEYTPPNPRLLITAFPVVIVPAYYLGRKSFAAACLVSGVLLAVLSALTFVGPTVRP
jgi:Gpi18-like mannosyltransferase